MKYAIISLFSLFSLLSCADEEAPKDTETNKYYADYLQIYNAYDSLGNEATLKALNEYLVEYPERNDAYVFKAYILAKQENYEEANKYFEIARDKDSLNIYSYEIQSAFLLYDTAKKVQTKKIILDGLAINDSSTALMNNLAWLNILEGNESEALKTVALGISYFKRNKNENLYRTGFVAAILANDSISKLLYQNKLESSKFADPVLIEQELMELGPLALLKSLE
jgi:tetratricopeptide (TPR) repeat protein